VGDRARGLRGWRRRHGPNGDAGEIAGDYVLAQADSVAVPVTILFDHCGDIQFRAGRMSLGEDGTWRMAIQTLDAGGNEEGAEDGGRFQRAGDRLAFQSDVYGDHFQGEIAPPMLHFYYDWCGEGHADMDLAFTD
jgi:hypothetical protein